MRMIVVTMIMMGTMMINSDDQKLMVAIKCLYTNLCSCFFLVEI